ncbi:hypothetical protein COV06_03940 [Candidatus Uhrbacteria bacterium CG10_big_fil_rev_8_21_14_0_10_50_16]|uniref:PDZ domain-containing protein n=1 Tax=Candidatus Uhrbacteria bacterium CG10_big_fil_rev_8_21_14_0_10_50_16 TaxID=1975039 RepID=A0A2H0RLP2_9BACT|nr:MAG: hypothetical protein COV06_03940 [Candidatus Uhrbacteria bacterium CG10_big_fil_rev_8_21_14_0_10_50_16]
MPPQRTTLFISVILLTSLTSAIVGALIADRTLDRYAESLNDQSIRTDVTRVKPTVLATAVDQTIAHVVEVASPASYPLIHVLDRVHSNGVVEEANIGHATALTSDGWFLIPQEIVDRVGSSLRLVMEGGVVAITKIVQDPETSFVFAKAEVVDVHVSTFGASERLAEGTPVFVVDGMHVYPRVLVDTWITDKEAMTSSDHYSRTYRLDAIVDVLPGALVADANGSVIGFLEGMDRVRPLHQLTSGLNHVLTTGTITRPVLGLLLIDRSRVVAADSVQQGLEVMNIMHGSVAEIAGLRVGDVIVRVQGESVQNQTLDEWVLGASEGDTLLLTVVRQETEQEISVTL